MAAYDITTLGSGLEFDATDAQKISVVKIPGLDRVAAVWVQSSTLIYVQVFSVNTSTGALAAIGSPLDIEPGTSSIDRCRVVAIDGSDLVVAWEGAGNDLFVQIIRMDGTGNCTLNGSATTVAFSVARNSCDAILWDSTHVLVSWAGAGDDGFAQIFTIAVGDGTDGTVTAVGTAHEYDTAQGLLSSLTKISSSKCFVAYSGVGDDGWSIVLDVDGSYNVTSAGAKFEWKDAIVLTGVNGVLVSAGSPTIVAIHWYDTGGVPNMQTLQIDTSTWAITAFGAEFDIYAAGSTTDDSQPKMFMYDATHLVVVTAGTDSDGFGATVSYNSGTGALATVDDVEFLAADVSYISLAEMGSGIYVVAYQDVTSADGFMQALSVELPAPPATNNANFFPFLDRR